MKKFLDSLFYRDYGDNWDDQIFRERINEILDLNHIVLDFGAGRGNVEAMNLRGCCASVMGIDVDEAVLANPYLDEAYLITGSTFPFEDNTFDVIVSDNVMEHVERPHDVMIEICRVLKPGGHFIFKTPNRNHYMPMIASMTPHWFHKVINQWRGRSSVDTFRVEYKFNSHKDILRSLPGLLKLETIEYIEGRPEYLRHFGPLYFIGIVYERLVNRFKWLSGLRIVIIGSVGKCDC